MQDAHWHNPSSATRAGQEASRQLDNLRTRLASLLGTDRERTVFCSGATEAANGALRSLAAMHGPSARVAMAPFEHSAVRAAAEAAFPGRIEWLPVMADGRADIEALHGTLDKPGIAAVFLMAANNETGVIQPWREALAECRSRGIAFASDVTQWPGRLPWDKGLAGADLIFASGHKSGAPKGTGFACFSPRLDGLVWQHGGGQEKGRRAGTEDLAGIAACVAAVETACAACTVEAAGRSAAARDAFERHVREAIPGLRIAGRESPRLPQTSALAMPIGDGLRWVRKLDRAGFAVGAGSACASHAGTPSPTLRSMGFDADTATHLVRCSADLQRPVAEWLDLAKAIVRIHHEFQADASSASPWIASP